MGAIITALGIIIGLFEKARAVKEKDLITRFMASTRHAIWRLWYETGYDFFWVNRTLNRHNIEIGYAEDNISRLWRYAKAVYNSAVSWAKWARSSAISEAQRLNRSTMTFLGRFIDSVIRWADKRMNRIDARIGSVVKWMREWLDYLNDRLDWTFGRVRLLLTDPRRLADWAIAAIWSAFWSYFERNIERIIVALLPRIIPLTIRYIRIIESIIVRVM